MREALISNFFMIVVIIGYTIFVGMNFSNFRKYAGEKLKVYKHNSTTKTMGYVISVLGIFYMIMFIMEKKKTPTMILTFALFMYFVILVGYISLKDIVMYENGIYYSGKFVRYLDMKDVEKVGKNGVQIKLNKFEKSKDENLSFVQKLKANLNPRRFSTGMVYMSKINDDQDFIKTMKKNIKTARKNKKISDRQN